VQTLVYHGPGATAWEEVADPKLAGAGYLRCRVCRHRSQATRSALDAELDPELDEPDTLDEPSTQGLQGSTTEATAGQHGAPRADGSGRRSLQVGCPVQHYARLVDGDDRYLDDRRQQFGTGCRDQSRGLGWSPPMRFA